MEKTINITGIESTDKTILLMDNKDKYTIWKLDKKTNTESEPHRQFQKFRPVVGDTMKIDVWEQDDSFINDKGKTINYTKRYINKIITDSEGNPESPVTPQNAPQAHYQSQVIPTQPQATNYQTMSYFEVKMLAEMRQFRETQDKMYNMLSNIVIGMGDLLNKDAMEIHSMDDHSKNLENVGLKPKSHLEDIPVIDEEITTKDVPFL